MFHISPKIQKDGDNGTLYLNEENVGEVGKNATCIFISLKRRLSLQETIDLLKVVNGLEMDFYQLELDIQYGEL